MEREEIIKEIIRLGNLLLEEKKKENPVEDDYDDYIPEPRNPNQCSATTKGKRCHKLVGHGGQHHDLVMDFFWGKQYD